MIFIKIIDSVLNFLVISFFIIALSLSFYALYDVHVVYEKTQMSDDILKYKPSLQGENSFGNKFSVSDLKEINKDIVGWVRIDDTNIDYPILAGLDNTDYLMKDYQGQYSPSGSIFLDYRNSRELNDDLFVIYGHNMSRGLMFSDLKKFKNKSFFDNHKTGKLYTESNIYQLTIYTFNLVDANKSIVYKLSQYKNDHNEEVIQTLLDSAIQKREIEDSIHKKLIVLSTCYGVGTYDRSILLATIDSVDESIAKFDDNQNDFTDASLSNYSNKKNSIEQIYTIIIYVIVFGIIYIRFMTSRFRKKK